MEDSTRLSARPISEWNQAIEFSFKTFFSSLSKAGVSLFLGNPLGSIKDLIDSGKAFQFGDEPEQLAYVLIKDALINAAHNMVDESKHFLELKFQVPEKIFDEPDYITFLDEIDTVLEASELSISGKEIQNPASISIVEDFKPFFGRWLKLFGLTDPQIQSILRRFPTYFVFAFHDAWRRNRGQYLTIEQELFTPATGAVEKELEWLHYHQWLQKQADEPVFGESFGIRDIYVPLRAFYFEKVKEDVKDEFDLRQKDTKKRKIPLWIHDALDQWIADTSLKASHLKVVTGGPGAGKSSLVKVWAAEASSQGHQVFFVPLHHFDVRGSLSDSFVEFIRLNPHCPSGHPLDWAGNGTAPITLIFDGLDELSKQGSFGEEVARNFVDEIHRYLIQLNQGKCRMKVLITGREVAVQSCESKLRDKGQVYHLLPYILEDHGGFIGREVDILKIDQRNDWWNIYAQLRNEARIKGLPQELKNKKLDEITAQPLLNYLVALSYQRQEVTFDENTNLNNIYEDLIKGVYSRAYDQNGQHKSVQAITFPQFIRILEEMAVSAWHGGDIRTTTVKRIEQQVERSGMQRLFQKVADDAELGIMRLLTAFYFRQIDNDGGNRTFEFTHKSFGEYLTARRLIGLLKRTENKISQRVTDPDEAWSDSECLFQWLRLSGPAPMTKYLKSFIKDELRNTRHSTLIVDYQELLSWICTLILRKGLPFDLGSRKNHGKESFQFQNTVESIVVLLSFCALQTKQISRILWESTHTAHSLIKVFNRSSYLEANSTGRRHFSLIDFSRQNFTRADLSYFKLQYCDFQNSLLESANLEGSDLMGSNFENCDLSGCNLNEAVLQNVSFRNSKLMLANLANSTFINVIFESANLCKANLSDVDLEQINMANTNLSRANISNAILNGSKLIQTDLTGSNLLNASLTDINLTDAILLKTNLIGANLERATLVRVNLRDAYLNQTILSRADLTGAELENIICQHTELEGCNLSLCNLFNAKLDFSNLKHTYFMGANLTSCTFSYCDLSQSDLKGVFAVDSNFQGANLIDANFENSFLEKANFKDADLQGANFKGSDLTSTFFPNVNAVGSSFDGANLDYSEFNFAILNESSFTKSSLYKVNISQAQLTSANFSHCSLIGAVFSRSNLCNADFSYANLTKATLEFVTNTNLNPVDWDIETVAGVNFTGTDLSYANLRNATLQSCIFKEAILKRANLDNAILIEANAAEADFSNTSLIEVDLSYSILENSNLTSANLSGSNLTKSNLRSANLKGACLAKVNFFGADLKGAILDYADLSGVVNLTLGQLRTCKSLKSCSGIQNLDRLMDT